MFQHSVGRLPKSKRAVAGRFALLPDIFFIDPENSILGTDSTIVAHVPKPGLGIISLLLVAIFLFLFLSILGIGVLGSEAQLDRSEATTQGIVVSHQVRSISSVNQGVLHYVTYLYAVAGQETTLTKEQFVTEATYNKFADGDLVLIKYLQTDPTMAELSGTDSTNGIAQNGYFMTVFGILGALTALVYLIFHTWQFWRDDVLVRKGSLLMGEVTRCEGKLDVTKTSLDSTSYGSPLRGTYSVELSYMFHTPEGKEVSGSVKARRNDLVDHPLPEFGTPIAVLYLDERRYKVL